MPRIERRNPRESKPIFLVWLGLALVRLGGILPEATEMAAMQHLQRQALLSLQGRTRSVRARTLRAKSVVPNAGPAQRRNTVPRRGNAECCAPCESHAVRHRIGSIQREFPDSSERQPSVASGWAERSCPPRPERRLQAPRGDRCD